MDEEADKQAEARRVLDAIRKKTELEQEEQSLPKEPMRWLVSEDAAQLQALVDQSRGIKNQAEAEESSPEPVGVNPISVEQIKVMRQSVASNEVHKSPVMQTIYEAIIRSYFDTKDFFSKTGRAKRCLLDGHQCVHCGEKFQAMPSSSSNSNESPTQ